MLVSYARNLARDVAWMPTRGPSVVRRLRKWRVPAPYPECTWPREDSQRHQRRQVWRRSTITKRRVDYERCTDPRDQCRRLPGPRDHSASRDLFGLKGGGAIV